MLLGRIVGPIVLERARASPRSRSLQEALAGHGLTR